MEKWGRRTLLFSLVSCLRGTMSILQPETTHKTLFPQFSILSYRPWLTHPLVAGPVNLTPPSSHLQGAYITSSLKAFFFFLLKASYSLPPSQRILLLLHHPQSGLTPHSTQLNLHQYLQHWMPSSHPLTTHPFRAKTQVLFIYVNMEPRTVSGAQ